MRVLITGGNGQLGMALRDALVQDEVTAPGHQDLDVTDAAAVHANFAEHRPEVVIHCAAWTDTAGCERDPERALAVNGAAAGAVATACASSGATMVYVSSNEVFDGEACEPYAEDATPRPINAYGRSKLAGEQAVAAALAEHCIVRTSWLYGPGRVSFPEKVLKAARAQGKLRMVSDEIASPTYTIDLADAIARLIRVNPRGIYHLTNEGVCSRLEWALAVLEIAGVSEAVVEEVTQDEFAAPYRKPVFSALANRRAADLGIVMRPWRESLAEHLAGAAANARAVRVQ